MKLFSDRLYETKYFENETFCMLLDYFYDSELLSKNEKFELEIYLNGMNLTKHLILMEGNFFDTLKNRYDKAAGVVKNFSDNAKKALDKLIDAAKSAEEFIKNLINKISEYCKSTLKNVKTKILEKLKNSDEFLNLIKEAAKNKENLKKDLMISKDVVKFYNEKFLSSLLDKIKKSITELFIGDKQPVVEKLNYIKSINEKVEMGNNVIQKLVHGLEEIPPFNWLHSLKSNMEKGINIVIGGLSDLTNKLGGPKFTLPVIASILAVVIEFNVKGLVKSGLMDMVLDYAIPFVGTVIKIVGLIATFIAAIELIDDISGLHILGNHEHNKTEIKVQPINTEKPVQNNIVGT